MSVLRWVPRAAALLAAVLVLYVALTGVQVWAAAHRDEAGAAEVIVVLGAAQYDGRPSPVLAARLDHAVDLYERDVADSIVVTGGSRPGDRFTEAAASARYLSARGVPGGAVERETTGGSSYESLAATARFLRDDGVHDVLLVSDPYHALRIRTIAEDVGLDARVSPTPGGLYSWESRVRNLVRETGAVALGRLVGFRRLDRLDT